MTPLQRKKAAIIESLETALSGIDGANDVIPGKYITPGNLVLQLAQCLMVRANNNNIEQIFADAIADLPDTVKNIAQIYGETPALVPYPGKDMSLLGNIFKYRQEKHGGPSLFQGYDYFNPSFIGPGGEIPEVIPGEGYTLIGEDILAKVASDQLHASTYFVHELAKAITAIEGDGYELFITEGRSSYVMLTSHGKAILDEALSFRLNTQDRRDIDHEIAAIAARHAAIIHEQEGLADERARMFAILEKTLASASGPGSCPMVPLGLDILEPAGQFRMRIAFTYLDRGKPRTTITCVPGPDNWYSLAITAKAHRKSVHEAAILDARGEYTISRPLAAFLHSRYGADISDIIAQAENSRDKACQIADPLSHDKSKTFVVMIRNAELRGRFELAPGVHWDHTKITFSEGSLPTAVQASLQNRNLNEIIDLSSIPGLEQVSMTAYYPKQRGFTLMLDSVPIPINDAMAAIEDQKLKRAA